MSITIPGNFFQDTIQYAQGVRSHNNTYCPQPPFSLFRLNTWDSGIAPATIAPSASQTAWTNTALKAWIADCVTYGAKGTMVLGPRTPQWAAANPNVTSGYGPGQSSPYANMSDFDAIMDFIFAADPNLVIDTYGMFNEPNGSPSTPTWTGTTAEMVALQTELYSKVKGHSSKLHVLSPAFVGYTGPSALDTFLAACNGTYPFDLIAFHGYAYYPNDQVVPFQAEQIVEPVVVTINGTPHTASAIVPAYKAVLAKYGLSGYPLWDTEHALTDAGAGSDQNYKAAYVFKTCLLEAAAGVALTNPYAIDSYGGYANCYDWSTGGYTTPWNKAYTTLRSLLRSATLPSGYSKSGTQWQVPATLKSGASALFVWDTAGGSFTVPTGFAYKSDIFGTKTAASPGTVLTLTTSPTILTSA